MLDEKEKRRIIQNGRRAFQQRKPATKVPFLADLARRDAWLEGYSEEALALFTDLRQNPAVLGMREALKNNVCSQWANIGVACRPNQKDKCLRCEALANFDRLAGGEK